jgi:hypothetical protein
MKRVIIGVAATLLLVGVPVGIRPALADVSPAAVNAGFVDYEVNDTHHQHALSSFSLPSAYYKRSGETEEFGLKTGASNRVEHDTDKHYTTGTKTFQGDLQVFRGISQQSVVQIFGGGPGGPILMIKCYGRNNGSLVVTRDSTKNMITNAFSAGKIRIKLVHNTSSHKLTVYVNGAQKWTGSDAGSSYKGGYNVKYGLYGSFNSATHTIWSNVTLTG